MGKLTPQIAAAYYGCRLKYSNEFGGYTETVDPMCFFHWNSEREKGKLILTPVSEISDEDALHVASITQKPDFAASEIVDYLRSKGYDCGYGPIKSLIEEGLAIRVKK